MKVLIQNRPDTIKVFGGDSVQTIKTAEYLRKLGVDVDISLELTPNVEQYDIVHLMNVTRVKFTYVQMMNAKMQRRKVVLSPIYWNTKAVNMAYLKTPLLFLRDPFLLAQLGKAAILSLAHLTISNDLSELLFNKMLASRVLSQADCLLPNSNAELEILKNDFAPIFQRETKKCVVVPNGVDASIFRDAHPWEFERKYGIRDFVLNVGRFSYRKNQLRLIKALKGSGMKVVFIGGSNDSSIYYGIKDAVDKAYYEKCKCNADSSFLFLPSMTQEELACAYSACRVFVLPSLYETPGLSALEAALAGTNVCLTYGGSTREYFSNLAVYFDPLDTNSMRRAVFKSFTEERNNVLREHVLSRFTWEKAAKNTLEAYDRVLCR